MSSETSNWGKYAPAKNKCWHAVGAALVEQNKEEIFWREFRKHSSVPEGWFTNVNGLSAMSMNINIWLEEEATDGEPLLLRLFGAALAAD